MLLKKIKKYAKNISFAHLYFSELRLTKLLDYSSFFAKYDSFDLTNNPFLQDDYEFIFIEIDQLNKHNFKIMNETIKENLSRNIVVFATDFKNSVLSKFLIFSSLNYAHPLENEEKKIQKILYNSLKEYIEKQNTKHQINISKKISDTFCLLIFEKNELVFANENTKKLFNLEELPSIRDAICKIKSVDILSTSNRDISTEISIPGKEKHRFKLYLNNFPKTQEKLITIIEDKKIREKSPNLTIDRFQFIEILKDKLAQNSIEHFPIILMFININNYNKLKNADTNITMHNLTKQILKRLFSEKNQDEKLVYWDENLFIIDSKETDFKIAKESLKNIHEKLIHLNYDQNFLPSISSSILDISFLELDEAITCIENISLNSYSKNDFKTDDFYELTNLNEYLDESEQIKYLLTNYLNNKTPIKLLNIYKGLCINTQSKILKIQDNNYFLSCQNLQAYSMKFEKKTVIQAPSLPKDIQAYMSYLNLEKSYVVLDKLSFLDSSPNNRQYTRVQPKIRMPISIEYEKLSLQAEVLDISTRAVAIITNRKIGDEYLHKNIKITLRLPNDSKEEKHDLIKTTAKVVNLFDITETKSKIVAMFDFEDPYNSNILRYIYDRQKELIAELKRASRL